MRRFASYTGLIIAAVVSTADADGTAAVLTPQKDNTLYQDAAGALSNGAGNYIFAGRTVQNDSASRRRALLSFDIAGNIPAGATITDVSLTMNMSRTPAGSALVSLHRALADWGEGASVAPGEEGSGAAAAPGDATWIHTFHDTDTWSAPGGDFAAGGSAIQVVVGLGSYTWTDADMVTDVQSWLDDPSVNFGWVVIGNEGLASTAKRFDSREFPDPANRPTLTVTYTGPPDVVPTTSEWSLLLMAILMLTAGTLVMHRRGVRTSPVYRV